MATQKRKYQRHEIWNNFIENSDKTKVLCEICNQSYNITTTSANLKKHYQIYHNDKYKQILQIQSNKDLNKDQVINNNTTIQKQKESILNQQDQDKPNLQQTKLTDFISKKQNIINLETVNNNINLNLVNSSNQKKRKYKITSDEKTFYIETKKLMIEKIETIFIE
jgi:hypothetical protein